MIFANNIGHEIKKTVFGSNPLDHRVPTNRNRYMIMILRVTTFLPRLLS